jgi:NAD(P)-dependent dehydrogenase (short-subunit alcohol dehydrogenase family)
MRAALVVGAGPGIGAAVIRRVAREGLAIGAIARSETSLAAALSGVAGEQTLGMPADVTDEQGLRCALDVIIARFGVPDVLVYNAALIQRDAVGDLSAWQHLAAWAVNVGGAITTIAHVAPSMAHAGHGTILLTGGMPEPEPGSASLSLGKAGVRALTELLAKTYGPSGLHVATVTVAGVVAPGTAFDPDAIAEHYWRLHIQPPGAWEHAFVFTGEPSPQADNGRAP